VVLDVEVHVQEELAMVLVYKIGAILVNADGYHTGQQMRELSTNHALHMSCKDSHELPLQVLIFSICPF